MDRKALGNRAEDAVADYLVQAGAQIVARNLRIGMLELDIVARIERIVLVVEVRYRSRASFTTGLSSVSRQKRQRIRTAGERLWDRRYRRDPSVERLRFDVASVSYDAGEPRIEYIVAAF